MTNFEETRKVLEKLYPHIPKHYRDDGVEYIRLYLPIDGWYDFSYRWGPLESNDFVIEHYGFEEPGGTSEGAKFVDKGYWVSEDHVRYTKGKVS